MRTRLHQFSRRMPRGSTPPPYRSVARSCRAPSATRCGRRTVREAGDAELLQSGGRRHLADPDEADALFADARDELFDDVFAERARHEHARRAGVDVRAPAFDRVGHPHVARAVLATQERVGAGVQCERHSLRVGGGDRSLDRSDRLGERLQLVFEVRPGDALTDRAADGLSRVAVACFEVGAHGYLDGACDAPAHVEHEVDGDLLAIGVAERRGDRVARGGERLGLGQCGDGLGAHNVPDVHHLEQLGGGVKSAEFGGGIGEGHPFSLGRPPARRAGAPRHRHPCRARVPCAGRPRRRGRGAATPRARRSCARARAPCPPRVPS